MSTVNEVTLDTSAPQHLVVATIGPAQDVRAKFKIPEDAHGNGSISVMDYQSSPFNATMTLSTSPTDNTGSYASIERTYHFRVGPGNTTSRQLVAGMTYYINVTLSHGAKVGGAGWSAPRQVAFEYRAPQ